MFFVLQQNNLTIAENIPLRLVCHALQLAQIKYHNFLERNYNLDHDSAVELVNEAFLYLKLKESPDIDPLTKGDEFGAGFSQSRTENYA